MGVKITRLFNNQDRVIDIRNTLNQDNQTNNNRNWYIPSNIRSRLRTRTRTRTRTTTRTTTSRNSRTTTSRNLRITTSRNSRSTPSVDVGIFTYQRNTRARQLIRNRNREIQLERIRARHAIIARENGQIIKNLSIKKPSKYAVSNYNFECCVCYTDKIQKKKFLVCNHSLCTRCYNKINLPKKCPLCRISI